MLHQPCVKKQHLGWTSPFGEAWYAVRCQDISKKTVALFKNKELPKELILIGNKGFLMSEQKLSCNYPGICVWRIENSIIKIYMSAWKKKKKPTRCGSTLRGTHIVMQKMTAPKLLDTDIQSPFCKVLSECFALWMQTTPSNGIIWIGMLLLSATIRLQSKPSHELEVGFQHAAHLLFQGWLHAREYIWKDFYSFILS